MAPAVSEVLLVDGISWGSVGPLLFISLAIMGQSRSRDHQPHGRRLGIRRAAIALVPDRDHRWHNDCAPGSRDRDYGRALGRSRDRSSSRTIVQDSRYRDLLRSDM